MTEKIFQGRVNRRRTKTNSRINIFLPSTMSEKIYDQNSSGLLSRSFEKFKNSKSELTESDLISIVESVYEGMDIRNSEHFMDANHRYIEVHDQLMGVFDNPNKFDDKTRKVEYTPDSCNPYKIQKRCFGSRIPAIKETNVRSEDAILVCPNSQGDCR